MGKNTERYGILVSTGSWLTYASRMTQDTTHEDVSDTREHVQAMRVKLDEIHKWYEENLKRPPQSHGSPRPPSYPSFDAGSFVLYEGRGNLGEAEAILCPHARVFLVEPAPAQLFPQAHINIVLNCLPDDGQAQKCFTIRGKR